MYIKLIKTLFLFLIASSGFAQTWNSLNTEYNNLTKNEQNDAALIKAKEIYSWIKANESDTSIHLPICFKLIIFKFALKFQMAEL